jgi:dolichyl-phosphate-mannose-protein mannosyltransferase
VENSKLNRINTKSRLLAVSFILIVDLFMIILFFRGDIRYFFQSDKPLVTKYGPIYSPDIQELQKGGYEIDGNWILRGSSLSLPPGNNGRFVISLNKDKESIPIFRLFTKDVKERCSLLFASFPGEQKIKVPLNGDIFELRGNAGSKVSRLEITAKTGASEESVIFFKNIEHILITKEAQKIFPFPAILALFLSPFVLFICLRLSFWRRVYSTFVFFFTAAFLCSVNKDIAHLMPIIFYLLIALILVWNFVKYKTLEKEKLFILLIFFFIVLGFSLRWPVLVENAGHKLDPDAFGYLSISQNNKGLFKTSIEIAPYIREPLFIWFIRASFVLFGINTDTVLRFLTVILSIFVIPAVFFAGKRWFGAGRALLASFFCTVNPYFIFMSTRGLRLELYLLCVLLFLTSLDWLRKKDLWGGFYVGLASGICLLARITSFSFTIPLTLFFCILRKAKFYNILIALMLSLILITPHLIFNYQTTGDAMFSSNIHAKFYRNREFAGEPGFPGKEEVIKDPYCGDPISSFKYIFGLHSTFEVARITLRGLFRIFLGKIAFRGLFGGSRLFFLFYLFGLGITLFSRQWKWVMVAVILNAPSTFLAGMHLDLRLTLHVAPLLYLFTANGIFFLCKKIKSVNQKSLSNFFNFFR